MLEKIQQRQLVVANHRHRRDRHRLPRFRRGARARGRDAGNSDGGLGFFIRLRGLLSFWFCFGFGFYFFGGNFFFLGRSGLEHRLGGLGSFFRLAPENFRRRCRGNFLGGRHQSFVIRWRWQMFGLRWLGGFPITPDLLRRRHAQIAHGRFGHGLPIRAETGRRGCSRGRNSGSFFFKLLAFAFQFASAALQGNFFGRLIFVGSGSGGPPVEQMMQPAADAEICQE